MLAKTHPNASREGNIRTEILELIDPKYLWQLLSKIFNIDRYHLIDWGRLSKHFQYGKPSGNTNFSYYSLSGLIENWNWTSHEFVCPSCYYPA